MQVVNNTMHLLADLTCAASATTQRGSRRIVLGDGHGVVRCYAVADGPASEGDVDLQRPLWAARVSTDAITSICVVADQRYAEGGSDAIVTVVGTCRGEIGFLRDHLEFQRRQLDTAAVVLIRHLRELEFVAADFAGTLHGIDPSERLYKAPLWAHTRGNVVRAMAPVRILDVEETLSSYVLVAPGTRELLLTHRGGVYGELSMPSTVTSILCVPSCKAIPDAPTNKTANSEKTEAETVKRSKKRVVLPEDWILVACEDGSVYRVFSHRESGSPRSFALRFEKFVAGTNSIPMDKLVAVRGEDAIAVADETALEWLSLGQDGSVTAYCGPKQQRQWSGLLSLDEIGAEGIAEDRLPVDLVSLSAASAPPLFAIVWPYRLRLFNMHNGATSSPSGPESM